MFSAYTIKKMLPRLIIAVIAVNLSWYLAIGMLNIANVLGGATREILLAPFSGFSTDVIGTLSGGQQGVVAAILGAGGIAMLFSSFAIFTPILVGGLIALFIGYVALVLRQAFLVMIIILSPILIALWVLPGMENVAKKAVSLFMKLLIMYPLIMALLISGRIVSAVLNNGSDTELLPKVIAMVALFAPYFMIPFALKFVGGVLAQVSNMANDRSRGLIDGLRKRGARKGAENRAGIIAGNRFKGGKADVDGKPLNMRGRLNRGLQTGSLVSKAGLRPGEMRGNIRSARGTADLRAAKELMEKNETFKNLASDDDKLWALMMGGGDINKVKTILQKRAPSRFNEETDPNTLNAAAAEIMRVQREGGGRATLMAATMAQAGTGTGYNYGNKGGYNDDMYDAIGRAAGGDKNLAGMMLGEMRPALKNSGRMEFAGGYANTAKILGRRMDAAANGRDDDMIMIDGEMTNYTRDQAMRETTRDAYMSNGGAFIAGKKQTIKMAAPMITADIRATAAAGPESFVREIANVAGKYDAAGAVAPQNAEELNTGVLQQTLDFASMHEDVRAKLRGTRYDDNGNIKKDRNGVELDPTKITVQEAMDHLRDDAVFQGTRREHGRTTADQARAEMLGRTGGIDQPGQFRPEGQ